MKHVKKFKKKLSLSSISRNYWYDDTLPINYLLKLPLYIHKNLQCFKPISHCTRKFQAPPQSECGNPNLCSLPST